MEPSDDSPEPAGPPAPPSRRESLVPALAVTAVAVVAVAAAVMVKRADTHAPLQAALAPQSAPAPGGEVVKAPPLQAPATSAMGGAAACKDCGVVEMVVAVYEPGHKEPRAYQMHIRMDDGSRRTIQRRGALAPGSRVLLEGSTIKPLP
jgi:hypothetical protein